MNKIDIWRKQNSLIDDILLLYRRKNSRYYWAAKGKKPLFYKEGAIENLERRIQYACLDMDIDIVDTIKAIRKIQYQYNARENVGNIGAAFMHALASLTR